jgi:hypothetical protein
MPSDAIHRALARAGELEERRRVECRLTPDLALETLDEAEAFLVNRGLLTLMPDCALPSLFGACHEEPYKPGSRGFGLWPKTKYPWGVELATRCIRTKLHRGKGLFMSSEAASLADTLCRAELARAEEGSHGPEAKRVVELLAELGPALPEELEADRRTRERLERVGALVTRPVLVEGGYTSEVARWDQVRPEPSPGGLDELVVAGVRAAVVAPEREAARWFSWRADVARLVEEGRLARPEPGWVCLP